jgi:hypothetical protein
MNTHGQIHVSRRLGDKWFLTLLKPGTFLRNLAALRYNKVAYPSLIHRHTEGSYLYKMCQCVMLSICLQCDAFLLAFSVRTSSNSNLQRALRDPKAEDDELVPVAVTLPPAARGVRAA